MKCICVLRFKKMAHLSEGGFVDRVSHQDVDVGGQKPADEFPPVTDPPIIRAAHFRSLSWEEKKGSYTDFECILKIRLLT